jgi:hypothetical protein
MTDLVVSLVSPAEVQNPVQDPPPVDPHQPEGSAPVHPLRRRPFIPVGANLAWAPDGKTDTMGLLPKGVPAFAKANLNWMRIWMAHWDGLNLDWLPPRHGSVAQTGIPERGRRGEAGTDPRSAEDNGVYVQVVLQHHGQVTTSTTQTGRRTPGTRPIRAASSRPPRNSSRIRTRGSSRCSSTATSSRAGAGPRRWCPGSSSTRSTGPTPSATGTRPRFARWHSSMATTSGSVDVYGHLITTSTENLRSPIYEKLDYYQPHLYAAEPHRGLARLRAAPLGAQPKPRSTARRATTTSPPPPR